MVFCMNTSMHIRYKLFDKLSNSLNSYFFHKHIKMGE